jgi:hypothetical protein
MGKDPEHAVFINEKFGSINTAKLYESWRNKMHYCFLTEQWRNYGTKYNNV